MSRITFAEDDDQPKARLAEARRRQAVLTDVVDRVRGAVTDAGTEFEADADWYVSVLLDGLIRRALVVEFREWAGHCEDLLRDQLSRQGLDPERWSSLRRGARGPALVAAVRRALVEELDASLPETVWDGLDELAMVAETLNDSTMAARQALQGRYPDYFSPIDPFGDGDEGGRLTLVPDHADRAFAAVTEFWSQGRGLPYTTRSSTAA